jgi:phage repressor protein C with HTH and peptisase S24 domain
VSEVKFSAGNGNIAHYEIIEDSGEASYQLSWFVKEGMKPENTKRFRVKGDSMEPFLYNNDTILVNFDEVNIVEGKLYAIRYGDELRVKYVHRLLNGSIILRSVNPFYKDEEITPELANEHITIIGRVRDKSGRGGL